MVEVNLTNIIIVFLTILLIFYIFLQIFEKKIKNQYLLEILDRISKEAINFTSHRHENREGEEYVRQKQLELLKAISILFYPLFQDNFSRRFYFFKHLIHKYLPLKFNEKELIKFYFHEEDHLDEKENECSIEDE